MTKFTPFQTNNDCSYSFGAGEFFPENRLLPRVMQKTGAQFCDACGLPDRTDVSRVSCNNCGGILILCREHIAGDFCPSCSMDKAGQQAGEWIKLSPIRPQNTERGERIRCFAEEMFKSNLRQIAYPESGITRSCDACSKLMDDIRQKKCSADGHSEFFARQNAMTEQRHNLMFCRSCGAPLTLCAEHIASGKCPCCQIIEDLDEDGSLESAIASYVGDGRPFEVPQETMDNLFTPAATGDTKKTEEAMAEAMAEDQASGGKRLAEIKRGTRISYGKQRAQDSTAQLATERGLLLKQTDVHPPGYAGKLPDIMTTRRTKIDPKTLSPITIKPAIQITKPIKIIQKEPTENLETDSGLKAETDDFFAASARRRSGR